MNFAPEVVYANYNPTSPIMQPILTKFLCFQNNPLSTHNFTDCLSEFNRKNVWLVTGASCPVNMGNISIKNQSNVQVVRSKNGFFENFFYSL
jgi:hypothetical protein